MPTPGPLLPLAGEAANIEGEALTLLEMGVGPPHPFEGFRKFLEPEVELSLLKHENCPRLSIPTS